VVTSEQAPKVQGISGLVLTIRFLTELALLAGLVVAVGASRSRAWPGCTPKMADSNGKRWLRWGVPTRSGWCLHADQHRG
jgi:hypothetical protein